MAQPAEQTASTGHASGSGDLLATKLFVPQLQTGFVHRTRLVEALDDGLTKGIVLVCAQAGFGKTALLADWAHHPQRPVAWLSLDGGDNDPSRFWRHAVAALERARPGIAERVTPLLGPPAPSSFEGLVTALINELAAQPDEGEVVLVLEDYHLIDSRPVHASVTFLLEHAPPELHLVLTSRTDPPLPVARLRGRGRLAELRADDLRFTFDEAAALLREAVGPDVALLDRAVTALVERTEGWAAGLQLATLSLRGRSDVEGFVATFSGSHRYVLDYLTDEVLEGQPSEVRAFLLETSVLDRLSGELCDAVTGRSDGQAMLEAIEWANLFLVPLDEVRGWWRYHHLFADLLRVRLVQERPERVPELHRNAAAWSEEHGLADDAVRHAMAAGEATWAARLIERHVDELVLWGEGVTVERWLAALPPEAAGSRPRLLVAKALLDINRGAAMDEGALDAIERAFADAADESYQPSVGRAASLFANVPAAIAFERALLAEFRGDAEAAIAFASRGLDESGEVEWMLRSLCQGLLGVGQMMAGRLEEAERAFISNIGRWRAAGERYLAALDSYRLGVVQRAKGRLDAALGTYQRALQFTAAPGRPVLPAAGFAYVGMAEVAYQRGELDSAEQLVTEGIPLCRQDIHTNLLATGLTSLAWVRQAKGDFARALRAIREAEEVAAGTGPLNPVPVQRARLQLAQGDLAGAARWVEELGLGATDGPSYSKEPEYLVLARVLLAQDLSDRALGLLGRLYELAAAQGRVGSIIEVRALQALALAAGGDEEGAVPALVEALSLAVSQGYVRVFVDEGAPMGALIGRVISAHRRDPAIARDVPLEYLGRLARAFQRAARAGTPNGSADGTNGPVVPGLVEALSERELEVLRLLAAGKRNREIADQLYLALDTVKKHVTHILEKLGAANRTEATARARELGLLTGSSDPPARSGR